MTREPGRYAALLEKQVELLQRLSCARYAFHRVRCKVYGDAVAEGRLSADQGREMYRLAMVNYDELLKSCGPLTEANEADMEKGFPL